VRVFLLLEDGEPLGLPDPPLNRITLADDQWAATALSQADAWALYVALVANSLHVELRRRVHWSIVDTPTSGLFELFDSRAMFRRQATGWGAGLYNVGLEYVGHGRGGDVLPSPPDRIWRFFEANAIVAGSRRETTARLFEWCRRNLVHFLYRQGALNMEQHWQYRGMPPVSRIIDGTISTAPRTPYSDRRHWTAGCHGTGGFLAATLRIVNIPVDCVRKAGHATPKFVWDELYLSHGDDLYSQYVRGDASYPVEELLISAPKYLEWFDPATPEAHAANIGRQPMELALIHLPSYLLSQYCHTPGAITNAFSRWYTRAQLDALGLWGRIQAKVAALGGCANIPPP
jgi:hypothetical protein